MFVYTVTKKKAVRAGLLAVAIVTGIAVGTAAVFNALKSSAAERKVPIYSVERTDKKIAVTFDCAWGNSNTDELLSILDKEGVPATFFVTGEFASKYPEDVVKMAAGKHEIGNHSNIHPHVVGMNINELIADTKEAERKITIAANEKPIYYRTPYGEYDDNVLTTVEGMGYKIIQWSADSVDWKESDPEKITKRIKDTVTEGGILLFHNDLPVTVTALPGIIADLKAKGYEFAPLSEVLYADNYKIDSTGKQIKVSPTVNSIEAAEVNATISGIPVTGADGSVITNAPTTGTLDIDGKDVENGADDEVGNDLTDPDAPLPSGNTISATSTTDPVLNNGGTLSPELQNGGSNTTLAPTTTEPIVSQEKG
ncbi:MAG: polysaccharide deacetylase family protein [Oscillospiraceae bacterium]|jgi:peptidoglycan/xylan/chitin deacetylase (PgdA/CDA1 family)|nr:polysaccharide deacetylase family protein [Oscillospiraceae bacterium]